MGLITTIFNTILYRPLFNILILIYQYLPGHDFGLAVIFLTILTKFLFYPLGAKAIKSQKTLEELQPKIQEIQKKYRDEKEKQLQATLELYREAKINPFSSLLPFLIQIPILIALYRVFWKGLNPDEMINLYYFVPRPTTINSNFFGLLDLSKPFLGLAILAGIFQFIQTKMLTPKIKGDDRLDRFSKMLQSQTLYFFPILTVLILLRLPAAIGLYWIVTTIFSIIQQYFILKPYAKPV